MSEYIERVFDIELSGEQSVVMSLPMLRSLLVNRIIELLNKNPERLMTVLYRIDVSETQVNSIFSSALPPDIPEMLADAILERQSQKVRSRSNL